MIVDTKHLTFGKRSVTIIIGASHIGKISIGAIIIGACKMGKNQYFLFFKKRYFPLIRYSVLKLVHARWEKAIFFILKKKIFPIN